MICSEGGDVGPTPDCRLLGHHAQMSLHMIEVEMHRMIVVGRECPLVPKMVVGRVAQYRRGECQDG